MQRAPVRTPADDTRKVKGGRGRETLSQRFSELAHLLEVMGVEQNPAKLDQLGRVLCNVDTMLITGSRNVDHDVSIKLERRALGGSHSDGHGSILASFRRVETTELGGAEVSKVGLGLLTENLNWSSQKTPEVKLFGFQRGEEARNPEFDLGVLAVVVVGKVKEEREN